MVGLALTLLVVQIVELFLHRYFVEADYQRAMVTEAQRQYAAQIDAIRANPDGPLPFPTTPRITLSDAIWRADSNIFDQQSEPSEVNTEALIREGLEKRGITPLDLFVQTGPSATFTHLEELNLNPPKGAPPPFETIIAGRFTGIDGWIHGRLRGGPQPPKLSPRDIGLLMLLTGAFGLIGIFFVSREIDRSMSLLRASAKVVGTTKATSVAQSNDVAEFQPVFDAFDRMSLRVSGLLKEKDILLAAIGHDLRSHLTILLSNLEMIETSREQISAIDNVRQIADLLDDIQTLASSEHIPRPTKRYEIGAIVQEVVGEFKMRGESVNFQNDSAASIPCRPDSLRRMLHNLINNAVAYAGMARVRMVDHDDKLSIIIEDEGPGIPDDMVLRVLNPFERGLRNSESGSGLGLALSSAVARMHGGELSLENRTSGVGLKVEVTLAK